MGVGEPDSYVVTPESTKKSSIFGKLKDKTRKAGSRIKTKVGKKKDPDGTYAPIVDGEGHEEDEEIVTSSDDSPSPASPASPATSGAAPRELGSTFQSEPSRYGSEDKKGESDSAVPDVSGLSLSEPAAKDESEPPVPTELMKASEDNDGTGATAGEEPAPTSKEPESDEITPVTENLASKETTDSDHVGAVPSEESGVETAGYDATTDTKDAITTGSADPQTKEAFESDELPSSTDIMAESRAYEANSATESKAMEIDQEAADQPKGESETKDDVAVDQPKGESETNDDVAVDQPKGESETNDDVAVDQPKGEIETKDDVAVDQPKGECETTDDAVEPKAEDLSDAPGDSESYSAKANDAAVDAEDTAADDTVGMNEAQPSEGRSEDQPSEGSSAMKETVGSAVDTTADDQVPQTKDEATGNSTGSALDTTKDQAGKAKQAVVEAATPKEEDKALSEKVTDALGAAPAKASDAAANVTETSRSPTTTTPGILTYAPAAHSSDHPASPGILGKIGGLFGFGAKAPEDHPHDHATH